MASKSSSVTHVLRSILHNTHNSPLFLYTHIVEAFHNYYPFQSHQSETIAASGFTTCDLPLGVCIAEGIPSTLVAKTASKIVSPWRVWL
jgi:hypothetical protein